MGSKVADGTPRASEADGSETTIEIKIKTLDSQTYTLRVDKQMPVPALKEQIASVTGVLSDQQRLICRGKVLKDDQLLSAYHVEDGHTLHLVVRQHMPPDEAMLNHPASDPNSSTSHGLTTQVAPGVVIETFSLPVQGDGIPPEINRIVSAVLSSIGLSSALSGSGGTDVREHGQQRPARASDATDLIDLDQHQPGGGRGPLHDTFGHPTAGSLGSLLPPVIPDSLTTLSQYLSHMRSEFNAIGRDRGDSAQAATNNGTEGRGLNSTSVLETIQEGLPTPASLAEVMFSTRQILVQEAGECLLQLARQLENQVNVTDTTARLSIQSSALRNGLLFHNLGALLLELGRTIMTLRMGQTPSEAVVNAGPAVFISQSSPNPIMVQPLPFQSSMSSSAIPMGAMQPGSSLIHGLGTGFLPRRIDIQIRRGSSTTTPTNVREENGDAQQPSQSREPVTGAGENLDNQATARVSEGLGLAGDGGVRVVPVRTMITTVPGPFTRLPSDSSSHSFGLYYPVLGRFQHASGEQGSETSGEQHPAGLDLHSVSDFVMQQQNMDDPTRDGSLPDSERQQGQSNTRGININILSAGGTPNNQESEREIPSGVVQFLRTLFPNGEIHVEDPNLQETASGSAGEHVTTSSHVVDTHEAEPRASDEGIFLSNLLRQVMPYISQQTGPEQDHPQTEAYADSSTQSCSNEFGTSRRQSDNDPDPPSSKRQKME